MQSIPMIIRSDEKGYIDRECPNEECLYTFKVRLKDWEEKVTDEAVYCPMCGHIATSEEWWTQEQLEQIRENASSAAINYIHSELGKAFKQLERSTRGNKFVKIKYKQGRRINFINHPIEQTGEWETEICCKRCGVHYSVVGAAFFCPCCGYNSAIDSYDSSLDSLQKTLDSITEMKKLLTDKYNKDDAETMRRGFVENSIRNMVSVFQKFAASVYEKVGGKTARINDFQIVSKGSELIEKVTGQGYEQFLSNQELRFMTIMFNRRHLLEHNNGMVDKKYMDQTDDEAYKIGQRVIIRTDDCYQLLKILRKLGSGLRGLSAEAEKEN